MPASEFRYRHTKLGDKDTNRLHTKWDNDLIMDWIETQPNPFEAPEFYEPMAEHDPQQITLSRDIREHLHETWSLAYQFIHPLAVEFFEHNDVSWTQRSMARREYAHVLLRMRPLTR